MASGRVGLGSLLGADYGSPSPVLLCSNSVFGMGLGVHEGMVGGSCVGGTLGFRAWGAGLRYRILL